MSRVGILEPTGLLGQELREQLEAQHELWRELRVYSRREAGIGTLTEAAGAAAMVQRLERDDLESLDLLFVCDPRPGELAILDPVPERLAAIVVAPTIAVPGGRAVVAPRALDEMRRGELLVSPHPAVVGLAHLLVPLEELGLDEVVATFLRPASMYDQEALEEVFEQTRSLLEFKSPSGGERFAHQIAFNVLPGPWDEAAAVVEQLGTLFARQPRIAAHSLQAGVFHGLSLSVFVALEPGIEAADVTAALAGDERVELAEIPESVGPVGAATADRILLGEIRPATGRPGGFWMWAALDNLTRVGASNAMEIARRLLG